MLTSSLCLLLQNCDISDLHRPSDNCPLDLSCCYYDLRLAPNYVMSYNRDQLFRYRTTTCTPTPGVLNALNHHGIGLKPSIAHRKERGGVGCRRKVPVILNNRPTNSGTPQAGHDPSNVTAVPCNKWDIPSLLLTNDRGGFITKHDELERPNTDSNCEVACATESWLNKHVPDSYQSISLHLILSDVTAIAGKGEESWFTSRTRYLSRTG